MKTPSFFGDVEGGKLKLRRRDLFDKYIQSLKGPIILQVAPEKKKRSRSQNNLYWVWLTIMGNELGYSNEEMHDIFKHKYLKEKKDIVNKKTGELMTVDFIRSTTSLNKAEMSDYMMKVERDSIELGIILPSPDMYYSLEE